VIASTMIDGCLYCPIAAGDTPYLTAKDARLAKKRKGKKKAQAAENVDEEEKDNTPPRELPGNEEHFCESSKHFHPQSAAIKAAFVRFQLAIMKIAGLLMQVISVSGSAMRDALMLTETKVAGVAVNTWIVNHPRVRKAIPEDCLVFHEPHISSLFHLLPHIFP
jgi:hypothetical protein